MDVRLFSAALVVAFAASPSAGYPATRTQPAQRLAHCATAFDGLDIGAPDTSLRSVPLRIIISCPVGVRWRLAVARPEDCDRPIDMDDSAVEVRLLTPAGTPWCDGARGTDVVSGVGVGTEQTIIGHALVRLAGTSAMTAGTHRGFVTFTLTSAPANATP